MVKDFFGKFTYMSQIYFEMYETKIEKNFSRYLLSTEDPTVKHIRKYTWYKRFKRLIKKEVKLANIKESDNLLFIGCGPFPISGFLYTLLSNSNIDCYDYNYEAFSIANKITKHIGLSDKVNILLGDHTTITESNYSAAIVAILAKHKIEILSHLKKLEIRKVICRTSQNVREIFYRPTKFDHISPYSVVNTTKIGPKDLITSVLLELK